MIESFELSKNILGAFLFNSPPSSLNRFCFLYHLLGRYQYLILTCTTCNTSNSNSSSNSGSDRSGGSYDGGGSESSNSSLLLIKISYLSNGQ